MIDVSAPPLATQVILEAYLGVLEVRPSCQKFNLPISDLKTRRRGKES
jgi:hypothetical protein